MSPRGSFSRKADKEVEIPDRASSRRSSAVEKLPVVLATVPLFVLLAIPAAAQATNGRTDSGEYNTVVLNVDDTEPSANGHFTNGVTFTPPKKELSISVSIADESGLPTRAIVVQEKEDASGRPNYLVKEEICGETKVPIEITQGVDVTVFAQEVPALTGRLPPRRSAP